MKEEGGIGGDWEEEWGISVGEERRHVGVEYDISDPNQGTLWAEEVWEGCQGE